MIFAIISFKCNNKDVISLFLIENTFFVYPHPPIKDNEKKKIIIIIIIIITLIKSYGTPQIAR